VVTPPRHAPWLEQSIICCSESERREPVAIW
jgi:hypothetical protein